MSDRMARALGLLFLSTALAEVKVPPISPQIQGVFPRGGQRGAEARITLTGRNLQDTREIRFTSPKLKATVLASDAYRVTASVRLAPDAEPGRHDLRLIAGHGSAISYFDVGNYPERSEKEPNDDEARAEPLVFPTVVNGLLRAADYDYYRFEARAGQVLTFDVLGTRNGANTDAALTLLDSSAEELAYSDDYYGFKDPRLVHRFEKSGAYLLRVWGSGEAGCDTCDYRLLAGEMPHAELAIPAGATRGSTAEFTLRGVNLQSAREVILGDGLARGEVLSASSQEARVRMPVPAAVAPGEYRLHLAGGMLPAPFVVSSYREITVVGDTARNRKDPVPVTLPIVANGILDRPRAADHFAFRVDAPITVVLETQAMQLGFLTDPLVAIYDASGKRLAWQDDPTTNTGKEPANMDPHLVFPIPKPGQYTALVRDAQFRGDPAFLYRLTIKEAEPDFSIRVIGTDETLYRGRTNAVLVRVRRLEGWTSPVEVWPDDLPAGVRAERVIAEPTNTPYTGTCGETHYLDGTNVEVRFTVDRDAPLSLAQIRFRGRGIHNGRTVERRARARYFRSRIRHIGDAEEEALRVVVAEAPGVVLAGPQSISLGADQTAAFTAVVTRLDEVAEPLELSLEAVAGGLTMEPLLVAASSTRAEVKLRAESKAPGEFVLVGRVNGAVIGKSHPIRVRSRS
jgi:hypothetical protein